MCLENRLPSSSESTPTTAASSSSSSSLVSGDEAAPAIRYGCQPPLLQCMSIKYFRPETSSKSGITFYNFHSPVKSYPHSRCFRPENLSHCLPGPGKAASPSFSTLSRCRNSKYVDWTRSLQYLRVQGLRTNGNCVRGRYGVQCMLLRVSLTCLTSEV